MEIVKTCTCALLCWFNGFFAHLAPIGVMESLVQMAQNGQVNAMAKLCDPYGQNDGDTACLCALSEDYQKKTCPSHHKITLQEFKSAFATARVLKTEVKVFQDNQIAEVPFLFFNSQTGQYVKETMVMINREGKWYLLSF